MHSRSLIHIMASGFVGISMLQYSMYIQSRRGPVLKLEDEVSKTFPDEKTKLDWLKTKVAELECGLSVQSDKFEVVQGGN